MLVEYRGETIDFGDTPEQEILAFFKAIESNEKQSEFDTLARLINEYRPEQRDYSSDLKDLGAVLVSIREAMDREQRDYGEDFNKLVDAVRGIDLPAPETVDFSPIIDALRVYRPEIDLGAVEAGIAAANDLLQTLVRKDNKIVMPPREKIKSFRIERNSAGNAERVHLEY